MQKLRRDHAVCRTCLYKYALLFYYAVLTFFGFPQPSYQVEEGNSVVQVCVRFLGNLRGALTRDVEIELDTVEDTAEREHNDMVACYKLIRL